MKEPEEPQESESLEEENADAGKKAIEETEHTEEDEVKKEDLAEEETREEPEEEVEEAKEEEVEKPRRGEVEEEIVDERFYTIPLGKAWISPRRKRAPRAIRLIKAFVERHMKMRDRGVEEEGGEIGRLVISKEVNEKVWSRGIEKPPRKLSVRVTKNNEGVVSVYLAKGD